MRTAIPLSITFFLTFVLTVHAMERSNEYIHKAKVRTTIQHMNEAAEEYTDLLFQLMQQPTLLGSPDEDKFPTLTKVEYKILPATCLSDCILCKLLTQRANDTMEEEDKWDVFTFTKNNLAPGRKNLQQGIGIIITKEVESNDFKQLCNAYQQVIEQIQTGWSFEGVESHISYPVLNKTESLIFPHLSKNEYALLTKDSPLLCEDALLRFFGQIFDIPLADFFAVHAQWIGVRKNKCYVWIKKDKYDECIQKLGLKIENNSQENKSTLSI